MSEPKRPLKVFLCHAHADRDSVRGLYTRLTQDGVNAWLDKANLLPGQDWKLEIEKAVREADVVVVCLSKQFNQAGFRQKEVRWALDTAMEKPEGEIFIVPIRLEKCDAFESLRKWHWVDLFEDDGYERLVQSLNAQADKIGVAFGILEPIKVTSRWNTHGKIVSVWSSSEEAGRQIFIANLAAQAALTGMRVGLADTDFALPTVQSMFGLDKPDTLKTINDYLYGRATIGEVGLPIHESNGQTSELKDTHIWLFPASVNPGEFLRIQREGINIGLLRDGFRDTYEKFNLDCLFINLPSNVDEETLLGIAISNVAIIVVRPDNLDYARTAAMIDTARKFEIPNVFLAVNNVLPKYDKYDFTEVKSKLEQTYDTPVLGVLPLFDDIVDDGNAGMFSINSSSHKWSRSLCSLAQSLFETKI